VKKVLALLYYHIKIDNISVWVSEPDSTPPPGIGGGWIDDWDTHVEEVFIFDVHILHLELDRKAAMPGILH
jgi:hypothetical protein